MELLLINIFIPVCTILAFIGTAILVTFLGIKTRGKDKTIEFYDMFDKKAVFLNSAVIWLVVHYYLVIASIVCSIIVIYINLMVEEDTKEILIFIYSVLSMLYVIGDIVIRPERISSKYRKAYILIDESLNKVKYLHTGEDDFPNILLKCEEIIHDGHS